VSAEENAVFESMSAKILSYPSNLVQS
jgi:hypothetical protein